MNTITKNKTILIAAFLVLCAMYVFNMFKDTFFVLPTAQENIGADIVELFANLEQVDLSENVFSSPLYRPLNDYSPELIAQPTGRTNPFNAIGR